MIVSLIGMPGSGKTTLGRIAAAKIGWAFYDLDEAIEAAAGESIPALFSQGEAIFRRWESLLCEEAAALKTDTIVACGGGVVVTPGNLEVLKKGGPILYLDRPLQSIAGDIALVGRPLLKDGIERLYALYEERHALYESGGDERIPNLGSVEEGAETIAKAAIRWKGKWR